MSEIKVASRYAKSLIDLATEQKVLDKVYKDMQLFHEVCMANKDLKAMLKSPVITSDRKFHVLQQLFGNKMEKITLSFFEITARKGREKMLIEIANSFFTQYNIIKGIVRATVTTSAPLTEESRKQVIALVEKINKGTVELESKVNPGLIGGFVLNVGDKQYDVSILSQIKGLKKELVSAQSEKN